MLIPSRPYLVRALYDWILDSDLTPYLLVDATLDKVIVPVESVQGGKIVLNIKPSSIRGLFIEDSYISFNARFSGKPMDIYIPFQAVEAIYAAENGVGMVFGSEPGSEVYSIIGQDSEPDAKPSKNEAEKKTTLRVIK